jgi:hypothetical protein
MIREMKQYIVESIDRVDTHTAEEMQVVGGCILLWVDGEVVAAGSWLSAAIAGRAKNA